MFEVSQESWKSANRLGVCREGVLTCLLYNQRRFLFVVHGILLDRGYLLNPCYSGLCPTSKRFLETLPYPM
jgi:hypothetical protein